MGFPTKNDHFGVFGAYHHFSKQPDGYSTSLQPVAHLLVIYE